MKYIYSIAVFMALVSCQKEDDTPKTNTGVVTFYRSIGGSWDLILDGINRGELRQSSIPPECEQLGFYTIELFTGTHTVDLMSNDGLAWGNPKEFIVKPGCQVVKATY